MRYIAILLLLLLTSAQVAAKCGGNEIMIWPLGETIAPNSIFVIEGYADGQEVINSLGSRFHIYLESDGKRFALQTVKKLQGQFLLNQIILKPEKNLIKGKKYTLYIEGLDKEFINFQSKSWLVSLPKDEKTPSWNCEPSINTSWLQYFGCGPEQRVLFCHEVSDNSETLIYTKVTNVNDNTSHDYYLIPVEAEILIGHGMCAGEFVFNQENEYEVQFGIMDACGNENKELTKPITFKPPTSEVKEPFEPCQCLATIRKKNVSSINYIAIVSFLIILSLFVFTIRILTKNKRRKSQS